MNYKDPISGLVHDVVETTKFFLRCELDKPFLFDPNRTEEQTNCLACLERRGQWIVFSSPGVAFVNIAALTKLEFIESDDEK